MQCSRRALLAWVLTLCLIGGCNARDETRASKESRRRFHAVMEGKLRQLDRGIATLAESPADSAAASELRLRQQTLQGQLKAMAAESDQSWLSLKENLEVEYRDLREQCALLDRNSSATSAHAEPDTVGTSGGVQTN